MEHYVFNKHEYLLMKIAVGFNGCILVVILVHLHIRN